MVVEERFVPARGLAHPYAQTAYGMFARRLPTLPSRRECWTTVDGDFIEVDIVEPDAPPRGFAVIVHGLEGSSRSPYAIGTLDRARAHGLVGIAMNYRCCGDMPNRFARSYHSGQTDDLRMVVREVAARWPGLRGGVVGFSLGANVTIKWLGEEGSAVPEPVRGAVAVSTPFDLGAGADWLDLPKNWWMRFQFLRSLKRKALEKAARFPMELDAAAIRAAPTLRAFDDIVTAPLNGFRDAAHYYARSSAKGYVDAVRRPLLLLSAVDDPLIPEVTIPRSAPARNDAVTLELTPNGGHVGFVAGSAFAPRFWAEERAIGFVDRMVAQGR